MVTEYFSLEDIRRCGGVPRGVVHVGGHYGEEAACYSEFSDVVWVEALPEYAARMAQDVAKYGQRAICALLSDVDGQLVKFYVTSDEFASSIYQPGYHKVQNPHVSIDSERMLFTQRFDTLWRERQLDQLDINMAVIDTQGSELKILQGMGHCLAQFDILVLEYSTVTDFYVGGPMLQDLENFLVDFKRVLPEELLIHGDACFLRTRPTRML